MARLQKYVLCLGWLFLSLYCLPVKAQEFSPAVVISDSTEVASSHHMAVNGKGKAVLVWVSAKIAGGTSIQASVYDPKTDVWSPTILEQSMAGVINTQVQVAINDDGKAIAVWAQALSDEIRIRYATLKRNQWSQPKTLFSTEVSDVSVDAPQVGIDAHGHAQAIWLRVPLNSGNTTLLASSFNGKKWSTPTTLDEQIFFEGAPSLAVNSEGSGLAAWLTSTNSLFAQFVRASSFKDGQWTTPVTLESQSDTVNAFSGVQVDIDAKGRGVAIWGALESEISAIHASRFNGKKWKSVITLASGDSDTEVFSQKIDLDPSGNGVAVWHSVNTADEIFTIQAATYFEKEWQEQVTIAMATAPQDVLSPNIGLNSLGDGAAVWAALSSTAKSVQIRTYADGAWSNSITTVAELRPASPLDRARPIVKADDHRDLYVSWIAFPPAPGRTSLFAAVGKHIIPEHCPCENCSSES